MRTLSISRTNLHGGVLVLALVTIGFVSVGFSAWIGLLAQRGRTAETEEHATRRRIAAGNSRAAIREYALERMITSSGDADGVTIDLLSGWSVTSTAQWTGYPMDSNTRLAGLNGFSLTWDYPYSKVIDVSAATLGLGFTTNTLGRIEQSFTPTTSYFKTYVRSRSPVLGGDLLVVHRSKLSVPVAPDVTGNIIVDGRVLHFVPELSASSYTARSVRFIAPSVSSPMQLRPKNLAGNDIPPSNLGWTPVTFGRVGTTTDLTGKLNVIDDINNGGNSLRQKLAGGSATLQNSGGTASVDPRGYNNNGSGTVIVTPCIGPSNPADLPSIIITDEVNELIIEGQDGTNLTEYAPYRPALAVVYIQDPASVRKLSTIRLRKQEARRMLLAIKQSGDTPGQNVNVIVEDSNSSSEWNVVIIAENTPLTFSATGGTTTIAIAGGIQTDAPLHGPAGGQQLSLLLQKDTRGLIKLAPRAAWVETIMPDKIPGSSADNTW